MYLYMYVQLKIWNSFLGDKQILQFFDRSVTLSCGATIVKVGSFRQNHRRYFGDHQIQSKLLNFQRNRIRLFKFYSLHFPEHSTRKKTLTFSRRSFFWQFCRKISFK